MEGGGEPVRWRRFALGCAASRTPPTEPEKPSIMHLRWAFAVVLLPLVCIGCQVPRPVTKPIPPPPKLSAADIGFLKLAAEDDAAQMQEAQLAQDRAPRPTLRQFAHQMITDKTENSRDLVTLAQNKGVSVSSAPDDQQSAEIQALDPLRGRAFDRAYLDDELSANAQEIALYQREADQGSDPEVKAFAQQMLPILRQHLSMAEALSPGSARVLGDEGTSRSDKGM